MKKFVLKLDLEDASDKRRALKTVSTLSGIDEISIDIKAKKLTVIGTVDPVSVVSKLRKKNWPTHIISVGPAKEPEPPKKEEAKKEEPKKDEAKKEEPAKEEPKKEEPKKEEAKKEEPKKEEEKKAPAPAPALEAQQMVLAANAMPYRPYYLPPQRPYYPPPPSYYYAHQSIEENPNACVIC